MKVILDGVFNHCGSFNKWLDRECIYEDAQGYEKGAYVSGESPYRTFLNSMRICGLTIITMTDGGDTIHFKIKL